MTFAPPSAMAITDQVFALLEGLSAATFYRSEVPDHPPTLAGDDRVAPYGVLYPMPGQPGDRAQQPLDWSAADLDWGCQVTCVAGYSADCEYLVDRVRIRLEGWSPSLANTAVGQLRPPAGYQPGPVQRSGPEVTPPRFWVPLQYRLTATTT